MPRIRKKTSNRGSTNKRARIQKKVAESRKKSKKAAKKNPQWKSKHTKDPGIPNNFPYKDQILAEVAEERRKAVEEKQRKKDEKKAAKNKSSPEDAEGSENAFDGIVNLGAKGLFSSDAKKVVEDQIKEADVPMLINHDLPNLKSVLDQADVLLQVLDARDPQSFRSSHLEEFALAKPGVKILLVLNKIDTCPRESVLLWAKQLRIQHPTFLFRVASSQLPTTTQPNMKGKGKAKEPDDDALGVDSILECLGLWAQEKEGGQPLTVAVVGFTNVGKSSFINSLLRKRILPTYKLSSSSRGPTTTTLPHEVTLEASGNQIRFIDTPGLSWITPVTPEKSPEDADEIRARDILLRNKGRIDRLKDPALAVAHIVLRSDTETLMLLYNLPAFAKGNTDAFLSSLARSHGLVKKHGELDLSGASRIVLRDWSTGKFPRYTTPQLPSSAVATPDTKLAEIYAKDDGILSTLTSRKEMRKSGGLVKFVCGIVEARKATIEEPWKCEDREDDSEGGEDDDDEVESTGEFVDEQEGSEEDEEKERGSEEDEDEDVEKPSPPIHEKRKRKRATEAPPLSNKKVAFAPNPKGSKQARLTASRKTQEKPRAQALDKKIKPAGPNTKQAKISSATGKRAQKVANVTTLSKLQKAALHGQTGEVEGGGAYDFNQFF